MSFKNVDIEMKMYLTSSDNSIKYKIMKYVKQTLQNEYKSSGLTSNLWPFHKSVGHLCLHLTYNVVINIDNNL